WQSEQVIIGTHMGTHIDAALHAYADSKQDAAAIPLEKCYGEAVMLDVRSLCEEPYALTVRDLEEAEKESGTQVREGDIVIIHTGWAARWGYGPNADQQKYMRPYGVNPGLGRDTPPWFIERGVTLVGIDTINVDYDHTITNHINFLWRETINEEPVQ